VFRFNYRTIVITCYIFYNYIHNIYIYITLYHFKTIRTIHGAFQSMVRPSYLLIHSQAVDFEALDIFGVDEAFSGDCR
jgi:hypothetical protein